ncbi:condensation domain-containing protein [Micromonospora gifhornensis]|uniref:condensation domain-containing protein n=1 Tax=Micromonospora gifhornensis TaxID=84594 RepID=UPI0036588BE3
MIPLSFNQDFLCSFDRGDEQGPFGPRNHIVHGWRVSGDIDVETLRLALHDLVVRHEALRTTVVRGEQRHQQVHPPQAPELVLLDVAGVPVDDRDQCVDELLNEVEAGTISGSEIPLIRAALGRFDDQDAILVLIAHHTATDGWSFRVLARDLAILYARRRGHQLDLPETVPYQEYARWQRSLTPQALTRQREYWRDNLAGARVFAVPTDRPKSLGLPESTSVHRFVIEAELVEPTVRLAKATRSTPFMVLLAAFNLLAQRMSNTTDVVVPTFSPGRVERFHHTVGPFFNMMPLRTDLSACRTFLDVIARTRRSCLDGYTNDMPFAMIAGEAPELMAPVMTDDQGACVFQVFPFPFVLDGELVGDLKYTEMRRRLISQPVGSDVPNGALWTLNLDPGGDVVGSVQFNSNIYDEVTITEMVAQYRQTLRESVVSPDSYLTLL